MQATVVGIFIAPKEGADVVAVDQVRAEAGCGLEGDRHYRPDAEDADQVTLIEMEGLEAARRDHGLDLIPGEHRRNIVTRGLDLGSLVGSKLKVGDAEVEAIRLNPPCRYLQELTGKPVVKGLHGRGGVRGRIVTSGVIRVGDPIVDQSR
ncbi:MAG: MOSC domain-containing protein [Acidimicrobiia bacterium]